VNRLALALAALTAAILPLGSPAGAADRHPLEVTVQTKEGKGIQGVQVTVTASSGEPFTIAGATDRKGRFRTEIPDFDRLYRVQAQKEGLAALEEEIDLAKAGVEAGQTAEVGLTMVPPTPVYYYELARKALAAHEVPRAIEAMEQSVALDATFVDGWRALSGLYLATERPADALSAADQALAAVPDDSGSLRNRFDALLALGRRDDADAALDALIEHVKTNETAVLSFNRGVEEMRDEHLEAAQSRFDQALEIDPTLHQACSALAELHIGKAEKLEDADQKKAELGQAIAALDRAIEITPRNFNAWERKIEVLKAMGRADEAAEAERHLAELRGGG